MGTNLPKITASNEFKIERGVPMAASRGAPPKYPFEHMAIGDSFFVGGKTVSQVSATAGGHGSRHNKKFSCRTVDGGVRIWRIA